MKRTHALCHAFPPQTGAADSGVAAEDVIKATLGYAREFERIV
jgi:hypothetical protein